MPILVYDLQLKRPGCALLQVAMGGTVSADLFPSDDWLLFPTPDLKAYQMTQEQLDVLVALHNLRALKNLKPK